MNEFFKLEVTNREIMIGNINVLGVASSSLILVGDTEVVTLSSMLDAPPEAVTLQQPVPLASVT